MTYILPLETRRRLAAGKRRRYWSNPEERLKRINMARAYRGAPLLNSLDEMVDPKTGRMNAPRDEKGRFA